MSHDSSKLKAIIGSYSKKYKHVYNYLTNNIPSFPSIEKFGENRIGFIRPKILLTVDIEALPIRASHDHFDRLILGNFGGTSYGILKMMDIAEKHNAKLTCFLDFCEYELYKDKLLNIAKEITLRGHDLQFHAHISQTPNELWKQYKCKRRPNLIKTLPQQAEAFLKYLFDVYSKINMPAGIPMPCAFRGASFNFNENILAAMAKYGLKISSNYNPWSKWQKNNKDVYAQFKWNNGIIELPISTLPRIWGYQMFNFEIYNLMPLKRISLWMQKFHQLLGDSAILVFILHSWSFLTETRNGHFYPLKAERNIAFFDEFLGNIKEKYDFTTASEIAELDSRSLLPISGIRNTELVKYL